MEDSVDAYDQKQHIMNATEQWEGWSTDSNAENESKNDNYDLGLGWPLDEELPNDMILEATNRMLKPGQGTITALNYGEDLGDDRFLKQLSLHLTNAYQHSTPESNLMVTGGASQALDLCCTQFKDKSNLIVFVENPTYYLAHKVIKTHGFDIIGIECDEGGMLISDLELKIKQFGKPSFLYIIPTHQNPTGRSMPNTRRESLVKFCTEQEVLIIADEVYHQLTWDSVKRKSFGSFDSNFTISVSSFTKILSPGLRVGWIHTSPSNINRLHQAGVILSGGALSNFTALIVADCIERGVFQIYLKNLIATYKTRAEALHQSLTKELEPLGVKFSNPQGGYFIWCTLPNPITTCQLMEVSQQVLFADGESFFATPTPETKRSFRICFVRYQPTHLRIAVQKLSLAIKSLL